MPNTEPPNPPTPPVAPLTAAGVPAPDGPKKREWKRVLVAGFLGGVATPLINPVREFLETHRYPPEFDSSYIFLGLGLGVVGMIMVWLLNETEPLKALALGVSLPAFFTSLGASGQIKAGPSAAVSPSVVHEVKGVPLGMIPFLSTAFAQPPPETEQAKSPERTMEVNIAGEAFAYRAEILDEADRVLKTLDINASKSELVAEPLPANAVSARFTAGDAFVTTKKQSLPSGYTAEVQLRPTSYVRKFTAAQVFGKPAELTPSNLAAVVVLRKKAPAGLKGWIYVGTFEGSKWGHYHTIEGMDVPKAGETRQVIFSVNIRDAQASGAKLAVASVFQRLRFLNVTDSEGSIWAQIEVQP